MSAPTNDAPRREMTLPELRKFDGQLFVMNTTPNKVTFNEKLGDKWVNFELDPVGEQDSIAFLPKLALDMRGLQKLWMKGWITISTDPDMEDQIMLLNAQAVGASEQRMREIMGSQTESTANRHIAEELCVGKVAGGRQCGLRNPQTQVIERGRVLQNQRQIKEGIPPLCPEHLDQAPSIVPRLVSDAKGEQHWEFDSVNLTQVQR